MISKAEYLMGRDKLFPDEYTAEIDRNCDEFLEVFNKVRVAYGKPMKVNSGYRPVSINSMTPSASKTSKHQICMAIDIDDPKGEVFKWCLDNLKLLTDLKLYLEHPNWTRTKSGGWTHFQLGAPASKKRIFVPSSALPVDPTFFNGKYDSKWDK